MNAVKEDIENLVQKELKAANEKFPLFASNHEGYAVIKEELEETEQDFEWCKEKLNCIWELIKQNNEPDIEVVWLKEFSMKCACEAIQVAAMAQKFIDSAESRGENRNE